MVTRNLTDIFVLMRNSSIQNRHFFRDSHADDDRTALVSNSHDIELGGGQGDVALPPVWLDSVEEFNYELTKIQEKIKDLLKLHDQHLQRSTLDDSVDEEQRIEIITEEITRMFTRNQSIVKQIANCKCSHRDEKLKANIVASMVKTLQATTTDFRQTQGIYLRKIQAREEKSARYFDSSLEAAADGRQLPDADDEENIIYDRAFTQKQKQAVSQNTELVEHREREISKITKSIVDLNSIFKDLATLVSEQGEVVDRIDYNVEQTSVKVEEGLKQLQKAEKHHKKNRKMMIIIALSALIIVLLVVLVLVKK